MMLFPYNNDPDTGSRIPSISTGGAAINAIIFAKHKLREEFQDLRNLSQFSSCEFEDELEAESESELKA